MSWNIHAGAGAHANVSFHTVDKLSAAVLEAHCMALMSDMTQV